MYTFTKLHLSVNEYGRKTKFGTKMKNKLKQSVVQCGIFALTAKLSNSWMNEQWTLLKAAEMISQAAFAGRYSR